MSDSRVRRFLEYLLWGHVLFLPISIALSEPLAYAVAPLAAWYFWREKARPVGPSPLRWPMWIFVAVAVASLAWSIRPGLTLHKLDRLLLLGVVFAVPLVWRSDRSDAAALAGKLVVLFLIGTSLQAALDVVRIPLSYVHAAQAHDALVQAGELSRRARRPTLFDMGNMRDPQMYMVSLSLLTGWILHRAAGSVTRWWWTALILNAAAFILHFKRGAWMAFVASAVLMALLAGRRRVMLILLLAVAGALAVPQVRDRLALLQEEFKLQTGGRYALWTEVAPRMMAEHPLGIGWKAARHEDFTRYEVRIQPKLNHLHNNAWQVRLELGWAGLLAWSAWMVTVLVMMGRNFRRLGADPAWSGLAYGVLGGFMALHLNGLVEYNFGDAEVFMLFNLLLALTALMWTIRPVPRAEPPATSPAPVVGS